MQDTIQDLLNQPWAISVILAFLILVILIIIVVIGNKRRKSKEISFTPKEELTATKDSGNYTAQGGFNFQAGAAQNTKEPAYATPPSSTEAAYPEVPTPQTEALQTGIDAKDSVNEGSKKIEQDVPVEPVNTTEIIQGDVPHTEVSPAQVPTETQSVENEQDDARDMIAPTEGRLQALRGRLASSQNVVGKSVLGLLTAGDLSEDAWEEIEDTLLMADLGLPSTTAIVEALRKRIAEQGVSSEQEARAILRDVMIQALHPDMDRSIKAMPYDGKPGVILVVGVNGTGKTTTTGKLSRVLVEQGHDVVLGAADTFRAAAADQLETWGSQVGAHTVRGHEQADPASVAFDAVAYGTDNGADVVLIDTAGRLHTSVGLMDQLEKVKRVAEKKAKVDEVILVLDATIGQNGLAQAKIFSDVVDITGIALTKLDGTAKGGIVFQVQDQLGVPVKLVGLGEGADDLAPFEVESFVDALLGEE